jgi:outer membrane protein OmpA-like peptidoglycan-associated protein
MIEITSHGESDPLVQTPDGVREPRNRRVELSIR